MSVAVLHQTLETGGSDCREETLLPRHVEAVDSNTLKISKVGMHVQLASKLNTEPISIFPKHSHVKSAKVYMVGRR